MLDKNITKFFAFVISNLAFCLIFSGCHSVSSQDGQQKKTDEKFSEKYEKPKVVGKLEASEITESSGLAASQCNQNVFWTHNDSGNKNEIFALDDKGKNLGKWIVSNSKNTDWEDIAAFKNANGECFLYIGDIGNNTRKRGEMTIYRVKEPKISDTNKTTEAAEAIKFEYPEMRHDAETLLVHPKTGDIYVLSKRLSGASAVYKLKSDFSLEKTNTLEKIADFSVPAIPNGFLTGGDISPDGQRVIICDYFNAYEIILPENAKNFDEIWTQKPDVIELGEREIGEAVCYSADGNSIFATSEKKNSPFIEVKRK
jgi:hypothetical protein